MDETLYIFTLFDRNSGLPRCAGVKDGGDIILVEFHRSGENKPLAKIFKNIKIIRKLMISAAKKSKPIVINDFMSHIKAFDLPDEHDYDVYDIHLGDVKTLLSRQEDHAFIRGAILRMEKRPFCEYQKILARAAFVYADLERHGLLINYSHRKPIWSQKTFSGRSKTTGFNIQGYSEPANIRPTGMSDTAVLLHFDWICADIRVASLLSGDTQLQRAFEISDPYQLMMEELNSESEEKIDRDECKTYLLKSINSMDFSSDALTFIYPGLGKWIRQCKQKLNKDGAFLETLLHRRFRLAFAKNALAVLNGAMQGSVAHAMQLCIRHIWDIYPQYIVAEIHDSLVMACPPDEKLLEKVIDKVSSIMLYPFEGVLDDNPAFPLKVGMGRKWKKWKTIRVYRESGVTHVGKKAKTTEGGKKASVQEVEENQTSEASDQ